MQTRPRHVTANRIPPGCKEPSRHDNESRPTYVARSHTSGYVLEVAQKSARCECFSSAIANSPSEVTIRCHNGDRKGPSVIRDDAHDCVVRRVRPSGCKYNIGLGRQGEGLAVEHEGCRVARQCGEFGDPFSELLDCTPAISPPAVWTRADDVHAVDQPPPGRHLVQVPTTSIPSPSTPGARLCQLRLNLATYSSPRLDPFLGRIRRRRPVFCILMKRPKDAARKRRSHVMPGV
jgi:hypothetical protein